MTTSHTGHDHPATSTARAACRRANGQNTPTGATNKGQLPLAKPTKAAKAERTAEANAKRTAAAKAKNPPKPRGECFECGGKAGWVDTKNDQPVCIKHVNYDRCRIIAL